MTNDEAIALAALLGATLSESGARHWEWLSDSDTLTGKYTPNSDDNGFLRSREKGYRWESVSWHPTAAVAALNFLEVLAYDP